MNTAQLPARQNLLELLCASTQYLDNIVETNNLDKFVVAITTAKYYNVSRLIAGHFCLQSGRQMR